MSEEYTLYIDESGEEGIAKIRTANTKGASPWLSFGACLIKNKDYEDIKLTIHEIEKQLNIPNL